MTAKPRRSVTQYYHLFVGMAICHIVIKDGRSLRQIAENHTFSIATLCGVVTRGKNMEMRTFFDIAHALGTTPTEILNLADGFSLQRSIELLRDSEFKDEMEEAIHLLFPRRPRHKQSLFEKQESAHLVRVT